MKKLTGVGVAMCLALVTQSAWGADVWVRDAAGGENPYGGKPGYYVPWTSSGGHLVGTVNGGFNSLLFSGTFQLEQDHGSGWEPLLTYCIEPDQPNLIETNPPDMTGLLYQLVPLSSLAGISLDEAVLIEKLWANAFDLSYVGATRRETTQHALAFQAILWELRQDDTIDFFTDSPTNLFRLESNDVFTVEVYDIAADWLNKIETNEWTDRTPLYALYSRESQDFITTVPEPATGVLMLAAGVLVLRRRR